MKDQDVAENWDEDFEDEHPRPEPSTPHSKSRKGAGNVWAEPGPSTPLKRFQQTENWDDDFQDADSPAHPARRPTRNGAAGGAVSPVENWDEEFEDSNPRSTTTSPRRRTPRKRPSWGSSDDEDNYPFVDREDDRTVTSRSRGTPFQLVTDVPPVPPLPSPFPRSPTASVFSVPVSSTGRDSVAGYSYSSTAHLALRPTVSGNSAVAARLALLPPSPPIHRERRRLRKKSRPPHHFEEGIFELDDRAELAAEQTRPITPDHPPKKPIVTLDDPSLDVGNTSTTTKTPLLSRIGSVGKKWGAGRKKRASTGPSEVVLHERDELPAAPRERGRPPPPDSDSSRPTSFIASSSPGHAGARSWFFRGGGGGQGPGPPPEREGALKHEKSVERLLHLMRVERDRDPREPGSPASLGRKGRVRLPVAVDAVALPHDLERALAVADGGTSVPSSPVVFGPSRRPMSMQVSAANSSSGSSWSSRPPVPRHVSYGDGRQPRPATPSSRASSKHRSASASVEDVHRVKKTSTRDIHDDRSSESHGHASPLKSPLEPGKGDRRFMGGMRRISLVGKHKRGKSGTVDEKDRKEKRPATAPSPIDPEPTHDQTTPRPSSRIVRTHQDVPLLPPIELQPPSPPPTKLESRPVLTVSTTTAVESQRGSSDHILEPSRSQPTYSTRSTTSQETAHPNISTPSASPTPTPKASVLSTAHTASLGRTTQIPKERDTPTNNSVPRRNSLGDLKIPARISQAQVGLRRDLSMVRDFATSVEQLKQLQATYTSLVSQVRALIDEPQETHSRPVSPSFIHLPKPSSRSRANTSPTAKAAATRSQLHTSFLSIEAKYRLSWECAELLIDLGGGATNGSSSPPPTSQSAPAVPSVSDGRKSRERAITLSGEVNPSPLNPSPLTPISPPLASPAPSQWRASTGRHDLSGRQLALLREMLNNPDPSATMSMEPDIPEEEINRNWRWGDAMNSTVTLPSEDSGPARGVQPSPTKRQQKPGKRGMRYIRDMLRNLTKNQAQIAGPPPSSSSVGASTDSSLNLPRPASVASRRNYHPNSPYGTTPSLPHKSSPRRPSIASIFRLGQKSKVSNVCGGPSVDDLSSNKNASGGSGQASGTSLGDEEDWDRVESASDLDHAARTLGFTSDGTATVRGKKGKSPYLLQQQHARGPEASRSSIFTPADPQPAPTHRPSAIPPSLMQSYSRSIKLSDVREHDAGGGDSCDAHVVHAPPRAPSRSRKRQSAPTGTASSSPRRPSSRARKNPTGSVRSAPPQPWGHPSPDGSASSTPTAAVDAKLAMAPENIRPLLENAREVHARCSECILEMQAVLENASALGLQAGPPPLPPS